MPFLGLSIQLQGEAQREVALPPAPTSSSGRDRNPRRLPNTQVD